RPACQRRRSKVERPKPEWATGRRAGCAGTPSLIVFTPRRERSALRCVHKTATFPILVRTAGKEGMREMIFWLGEDGAHEAAVAGGKAAALSRLASTYRVPPGFVVTDGAH